MKRVLCVWLPDWPIQRLVHARPELEGRPIILHAAQGGRGSIVVGCSQSATRAGISPGIPLAEATGLLATAEFLPCDPAADRAMLIDLARRCQRFTPRVALEESETPAALLLDIAGSAHLFGDEANLQRLVQSELGSFSTRVAIADTVGSAWALARYGNLHTPLAELPVAGLRLSDEVLRKLQRLGLLTVGQVQALPRSALPSRFGTQLLERLDQLTGRRPEIVPLVEPLDPLCAEWVFDDPVSDRVTLESVVHELLRRIAAELLQRRQATSQVTCELTSQPPLVLRLSQPTTSAGHLQELAALQLERRCWSGAVTRVQMTAQVLPLPVVRARTLFDDAGRHEQHLGLLLDRLRNRCQDDSVVFAALVDDWLPERSVRYRLDPSRLVGPCSGPAPLRLYSRPQPVSVVAHQGRPVRLRWQQREEPVAHAIGPHRIEAGWWRRQFIRRDYYRVTTARGERLWLFRQRESWFVCGE